jgi:tetratricopeptide (TPR) repeat protein
MHGTSPSRLEAARVLARILRESGARSVAHASSDTLASGRLAPVYTVSGGPRFAWAHTLPLAFARRIGVGHGPRPTLSVRGADADRIQALEPLLSQATERLEAAELDDRATLPDLDVPRGEGGFVAMLDALRWVSFTVPRPGDLPHLRRELRRGVGGLPRATWDQAESVADALHDLDRLPGALFALAKALETAGSLAASAAAHVILYELALLRCDVELGLEAAHGAGRTFRRLTSWSEALRWYQLGLRLAMHDENFLLATRLLDGLGNTHRERGAFPSARRCYRDASWLALVVGDPVEIGNVALGLMTVEREGGRLDTAARIAWRALTVQTDPRQRMNLLLNLGTLLRDGGAVDLAEDTYHLVALGADEAEVHLMARDALAYCAALRGARATYRRRRRAVRCRARGVTPYIRAQIGYFRGASLRLLGDGRAARVLRATERYARRHGLKEWEVRAGALADASMTPRVGAAAPPMRAPDEVREGIQALLAAAPAGGGGF